MKNSITVQNIELTRYLTDKYVILNFYISDLVNSQIKVIEIIVKIHLIHNLKVKLLVNINVLDSEEMNISFHNCFLIIDSEDE